MKKRAIINLILPIVAVVCIVIIWAISASAIDNEYILPSVSETIKSVFELFSDGKFYLSFSLTLFRSFIAFLISFVIAFLLAVLSEKLKHAERVIAPIISITRALPTIAVVLLLLFWTNSLIAPIVVTTLVVLPTQYTHLRSAFGALDKTVLEAGRVDGADEKRVFRYIQLPLTLPAIYSGIGSGISLNFKLMVAAEVLSQTANSIGFMLSTSKAYFEIAEMMALVVVAVIFGVVIEAIFNRLSKKAFDF